MSEIKLKNPEAKIYFPNLDGLRFVAFPIVFMDHIFISENVNVTGRSFGSELLALISYGGAAITTFFVLSGFLITYLILSEVNLRGNVNIGYFYIRRILRIWPLYYLMIFAAFFAYPILHAHGITQESHLGYNSIYYFFFISNFDVVHINQLFHGADALKFAGGVTWSVAVEEQFYLVWPLLFFFIPKKYYQWIFVAVIAVCLAFRYMHHDDDKILYFHTLGVCSDLALGGLCAYLTLKYASFKEFFAQLKRPVIITMYALAILWMMFNRHYFDFEYSPVISRLITASFFAFIIMEQNYSEHSFFKLSHSRFITFWGKYTYGMYLIHPVAISVSGSLVRKLHLHFHNTTANVIVHAIPGFAFSLLFSYISYEFYESKFLKLKKKFTFIRSSR